MPFMRLTTKWRSFVFATVAISQICASPQTHAQAPGLTETAQKSIAYIYFDVIDPNTGAKSTIQGTGFVVSKNGYVLTASHLFRAWRKQSDVDKANNPIKGTLRDKVGSVPESPRNLQIVNAGDPDAEDVALLKLPYPGTEAYPAAAICFSKAAAAKPGDNLLAFGFPLDQNFQPVPATLGTQNAPGGRWAAASAFTEGMSGGPVYSLEGFVVGLVKGGLDSQAVRWITPIQHAANYLNAAGLVEQSLAVAPYTPSSFDRSYQIDETKDDHSSSTSSKYYSYDFHADPGAEITSARFVETSANASSDKTINISADRQSVNFRFKLKSGPFFDQWRGWWHGTLILSQQSKPAASGVGSGGCQ